MPTYLVGWYSIEITHELQRTFGTLLLYGFSDPTNVHMEGYLTSNTLPNDEYTFPQQVV